MRRVGGFGGSKVWVGFLDGGDRSCRSATVGMVDQGPARWGSLWVILRSARISGTFPVMASRSLIGNYACGAQISPCRRF